MVHIPKPRGYLCDRRKKNPSQSSSFFHHPAHRSQFHSLHIIQAFLQLITFSVGSLILFLHPVSCQFVAVPSRGIVLCVQMYRKRILTWEVVPLFCCLDQKKEKNGARTKGNTFAALRFSSVFSSSAVVKVSFF